MEWQMMVACTNANGEPDLFDCIVEASEAERAEGLHYERAEELAEENDYEGPMVCYELAEFKRALSYKQDVLGV